MRRMNVAVAGWVLVLAGLPAAAVAQAEADNIGHTRHKHHHNPKHETDAPTPERFVTSRRSDIVLPLPQEKDAFVFAVFGDRTGGPVDGVKVLADAVRDVNLIEPDMVMTVGDLINGYNDTPKWLEQMTEFKGVMGELRCPWFPVVGNHDIYWRGEGTKPEGENEKNYEMHFGPLWYAFEHKNCWFIALYSDEGNPETGEKSISKPDSQRMSEEQFNWLKGTLAKAKGAEHVFLFLHHPRWLGGNYGDDWNKVHKELVAAGNVTAVFAGHIHRMRYDPKDGIEYVTLATVGGHQDGVVPDAGWLHHYHLITVRKKQVAMAAVPVGEVMDVRELTGKLADECANLYEQAPKFEGAVGFAADGGVDQKIVYEIANPTSREVDLTVTPESADSRWVFSPDHDHTRIAPGATGKIAFRVRRDGVGLDHYLRLPEVVVNADVLMPGHRYSMPERRIEMPLDLGTLGVPAMPAAEQAMEMDGDDAIRIDPAVAELPDGAMTVECWVRPAKLSARVGLVSKAEQSEWGLFANDGRVEFSVFVGGGTYITAAAKDVRLKTDVWQHVAGVYDGREVRVYVDGRVVGRTSAENAQPTRKRNKLPVMVGADVGNRGEANSRLDGRIDSVRLSRSARYMSEQFEPVRRAEADAEAVVVFNMDRMFGPYVWGQQATGPITTRVVGSPRVVTAE
jgi:hypothetical protein